LISSVTAPNIHALNAAWISLRLALFVVKRQFGLWRRTRRRQQAIQFFF
jgi:hypothetical protein